MKTLRFLSAISLVCAPILGGPPPELKDEKSLFDGTTLEGWEGNAQIWRVEDGALTGGNLRDTITRNEFLATKRDFTNFVIRFKIKLLGTEGFINSGFQIRSQRNPKNSEMAGYQCDFGEPNWYGAIYDEDRRNKVMSASDMTALRRVIKTNDWNDYVIKADGSRVTTWINGVQGTDFIEQDPSIARFGKLGIQVHGGGKAKVQVKDVEIQELPPTPAFEGAAAPKKLSQTGPLSPEDERATFTVPPEFEIELVAKESEGIGKFVAVNFDTQGRMWTMTAMEYPVDANESPEVAKALYRSIAKDKVLVFDKPFGPGPHTPRVFAEGLAIPLGMLPYKDGVYVQHGPDIKFLRDTDGDGKADKTETILTGFGVQDSHLFPHQFTRAPGNWIWMAQGAFNYGKVKTTKGAEVKFDQTRMAKFRYDGSDFDITSQGPCNIWGLVLKPNGEAFIQEANDYGYPMMQFHEYANYPGCSDAQFKSYAPIFPGTAPDFQMGGTGLSGLALSDKRHWPRPYDDVFYIANPITRKINAIRLHEDGARYRYEKLPDFLQSGDEYFRPVALTMGPDGNLYIVDWYNKIISHNEVPRTHPERDKTRGRIWRVKPKNLAPYNVPNFAKIPEMQILPYFTARGAGEVHLAWQAVVDRNLTNLISNLRMMAGGGVISALWALEGLNAVDTNTVAKMIGHSDRNVRREAVRAIGQLGEMFGFLERLDKETDPEVRAQIIRSAGLYPNMRSINLIAKFALPSLDGPTMPSTHDAKKIIKIREAYEREFERYLVRFVLERNPDLVNQWFTAGNSASPESDLLIALAAEPKFSARLIAKLLPKAKRPASDEELLRLVQFPAETGVAETLKSLLNNGDALQGLIRVRSRFDADAITPLLTDIARDLWSGSNPGLAVQLVSAFRLAAFENDLTMALRKTDLSPTNQISALRALREIGSSQDEVFSALAKAAKDRMVRHEAILTLASSKSEKAPALISDLWHDLNALQRRLTLERLTSSKPHATALVRLVGSGAFPKTDLDSASLDRLHAILPNDPDVQKLLSELTARYQTVLRLDGKNDSYLDTDITLDGAFTIETWIKLAPGIDNNDSLLGAPGELDLNFYDSRFRVWAGPDGDIVVSKKKMLPDIWTHISITRSMEGIFSIFINGELEAVGTKPVKRKFEHLKIGWSGPSKGTDAWLNAWRFWKVENPAPRIRQSFDTTFQNSAGAFGLGREFSGDEWKQFEKSFRGGARLERVNDFPDLVTTTQRQQREKIFSRFHRLAEERGDTNKGRMLFTTTCATCHTVAGHGGQIGPVLNGAAASGLETLLRAVLTPNAAMEAGYRSYRVELKNGDILDGFLVSQNEEAVVLRQPNAQDRRILQDEVRRASFTKTSLMPEGLLEGLPERDATDLLAYLQTLK